MTRRTIVRGAAALLFVLVTTGVALAPTLGTPFELIDDHSILAATSARGLALEATGHEPTFRGAVREDFGDHARVRPAYQAFFHAQAAAFGDDPRAWHLFSVLLALVTAGLLFAALLLLGAPPEAAAIGAALATLAPDALVSWVRLGPAEGPAMALLAVALVLALIKNGSRGRDAALVAVLVLMCLTKETFVLALPAVLAVRLLGAGGWRTEVAVAEVRASPWLLVVPMAVGALVLASAVAGAAVAGSDSYGGASIGGASSALGRLPSILGRIVRRWELWVPTAVAALLAWRAREPRSGNGDDRAGEAPLVAFALIALVLGALPQALVYSTRPVFYGHYWYPLASFGGIATGASLGAVGKRHRAAALLLGGVLLASFLVTHLRPAHREAESHRAKWVAFDRMIDFVADSAGPAEVVLVPARPGEDFEYSLAVPYFLAAAGREDLRPVLLVDSTGADPVPADLMARLVRTYGSAAGADPCRARWAIVFRAHPLRDRPTACAPLDTVDFVDSLRLPSLSRLRTFTTPGPHFRLLVPGG